MLSSSPPVFLMLCLSTGVLVWQQVMGHTYTSAQAMHLPPIVLLTSISTCTGCVLFFVAIIVSSVVRGFMLTQSPGVEAVEFGEVRTVPHAHL